MIGRRDGGGRGEEIAPSGRMRRPYFAAVTQRSTTSNRGEERSVELVHATERVPGTLLLPDRTGPVPAVLLMHGFSSNKARMADSVGRALQLRGIASLSVDLPYHGERGAGRDSVPYHNPLAVVGAWRLAVREASAALEWLASAPEVDGDRLGVLGYSLGGFLALMTAAEDRLVRAVALAAAGDLPETMPYASMIRRAVDPLRAVRRLEGRPLLLVNGRRDTTTRPAQAERLFAYAEEPRQLTWYDGGHWPPVSAIEDAAEWMARRLAEERGGARQAG
jgi:dienelactone hydrolase